MSRIHHSAICVRDVDASMRFWCDGLGFEEIMDHTFEGDWPTLLRAPTSSLRAVFLGDPGNPDAGIVELVDFGAVPDGAMSADDPAANGFLLLSVMTDLHGALARLSDVGLGGLPRRATVHGVDMAVVVDPNGVHVELVDTGAIANLERMAAGPVEQR
jgi:catechol 2,3-dioxygenase-like lactoylglutathione lyase family enzyme